MKLPWLTFKKKQQCIFFDKATDSNIILHISSSQIPSSSPQSPSLPLSQSISPILTTYIWHTFWSIIEKIYPLPDSNHISSSVSNFMPMALFSLLNMLIFHAYLLTTHLLLLICVFYTKNAAAKLKCASSSGSTYDEVNISICHLHLYPKFLKLA